jgi:hypothetical protein
MGEQDGIAAQARLWRSEPSGISMHDAQIHANTLSFCRLIDL